MVDDDDDSGTAVWFVPVSIVVVASSVEVLIVEWIVVVVGFC